MNENQTIPRSEDIDVYHSLDEGGACKRFLGKTLAEAEALFRDNSIYYQEDLLWMGPVAFRFYIHAAINYVHSEHADGDSDLISCLASIFRYRLKNEASELRPIAHLLAGFCSYVIEHWDRFDITSHFHPNLRSDYSALISDFQCLADDTNRHV